MLLIHSAHLSGYLSPSQCAILQSQAIEQRQHDLPYYQNKPSIISMIQSIEEIAPKRGDAIWLQRILFPNDINFHNEQFFHIRP